MKGFIYLTTNNINNRKYIGKKYYFYKNGNESNWRDYLGSSKLLKEDIAKYGKENFSKIILEEGETEDHLASLEKKYIDLYNAVDDNMFYNISNNVDKFFSTPDSIEKGKHTRKQWSESKKIAVLSKLKNRWSNMDELKKLERNKKISNALKNNKKFQEARKITQENVWANHSEEKKQNILNKRSNTLKCRWESLSDAEKHLHIEKRQHAFEKMHENRKQKALAIRDSWASKFVTIQNIKTHTSYEKTIRDAAIEFNIPLNTLILMYKVEIGVSKSKYGTHNIYNRTWKIITN